MTPLPKHTSAAIMETSMQEMEVKAIPNQFWGAIKIFTEKPHVINRRICGTVNLWIGVCEENQYSRDSVLASIVDVIEYAAKDGDGSDLQESMAELHAKFDADKKYANTNTFNATDEWKCQIQQTTLEIKKERSTVSENEERGRKFNTDSHKHLSLIRKTLEDNYFKPLSSYNIKKVQGDCQASETDNNGNNDNNNDKDDMAIKRPHVAKPQDGCKVSENYNNGDSDSSKTKEEAVMGTDHIAKIQNECKSSKHNDTDNKPDEDKVIRTGHQIASSDYQKRKLTIPWGYLTNTNNTIAIVRRILPKQVEKFESAVEVVLLDDRHKEATYITCTHSSQPSINPKVNYSISLIASGIRLSCFLGGREEEVEPSMIWLTNTVLPKVVKWASEVSVDGRVEDRGSLRLVDVAEYNELYQRLKIKYGKPLVKMWPEVTDPLKFVYEDIAIATYLMLLWRWERRQKGLAAPQSFIDLGCGNGLLVYILAGEGHTGLGIDVKKRKIWELFPSHVQLKEGIIEPSDKNLFPEYDWLIGNHSDELTPWIPVIAAKSGYNSRFMVIPCCAHDFSHRYRRRHAGRSQYADYLDYVQEIGRVCGFNMAQDKLRIPSTKRICLIGRDRTVDVFGYGKVLQAIDVFIKERTEAANEQSVEKPNGKGSCHSPPSAESMVLASNETADISSSDKHSEAIESFTNEKKATKHLYNEAEIKSTSEPLQSTAQECLSTANMWTENFKPRECVQPVRNCTQIKRKTREDIISAIVHMLMEKRHLVEVDIGNSNAPTTVTWDCGGSMALSDLAQRLSRPLLAAMKRECGGLQTLLKNHRYIFSLSDGLVSLQVPQPSWRKTTTPHTLVKSKVCWFDAHHRAGCPLPAHNCLYAHGEDDLRHT